MEILKIAIAGFGGVGRATAALLLKRLPRYREVYGLDVRLVSVSGSRAGLDDERGLGPERLNAPLEDGLSGPEFIAASNADILIEAGPSDVRTGAPGLAYIRASLAAGRDVIVISKGALALSAPELRSLAHKSGAMLKVSGAAGAALPALNLLTHSLKGCHVLEIEGILNATTNYLLDAMMNQGVGFPKALAGAKAGGFAEADPRSDTEGWDTAAKLLILANFGLGADLTMKDIAVDGIQSLSKQTISAWRAEQRVPKLIGRLIRENGAVRATVGVRLYPSGDPLAQVSGKNKAVRIVTEEMGEMIAIGSGTEPFATAAAALKDLEHIMMARRATSPRRY